MPTRTPTDWMWAQACELLDQADRMHRQFFRPSGYDRPQGMWEPPVDIFEDDVELIVVVALPGVPAERIEVSTEGADLVVRAQSRFPFSGTRRAVRRLEIPYGHFERRIRLPEGRYEDVTRELVNGCLTLRLRKVGSRGSA
jgi:HSP20 family protein